MNINNLEYVFCNQTENTFSPYFSYMVSFTLLSSNINLDKEKKHSFNKYFKK